MTELLKITGIIESIITDRRERAARLTLIRDQLALLVSTLESVRQRVAPYEDEVDFDASVARQSEKCTDQLVKARYDVDRLIARWSKETITIGVAGKARQGKSQLLQAITGLPNTILPTSDGLPTTGARSRISVGKGDTSAIVSFLTKEEFLSGIVAEYFRDVRLGPSPPNWEAFSKSLPSLPSDATQSQRTQYDLLTVLHKHRNDFGRLLGTKDQEVTPDQIVEYVSQSDREDGTQRHNYLAVRQVEIHTQFPNLPECKLSVIDLPGLGEIARGHAAKLVDSLEKEADAVLYVNLPPDTGGKWGEDDIAVFDCIDDAIPELPLEAYLYLVLNERSDGKNIKLIEALMKAMPPGISECEVYRVVALDHDRVISNLFHPLLQSLTSKLVEFDNHLLESCRESVKNAVGHVKPLIDLLSLASGDSGDGGARHYNPLRDSFLEDLIGQFEQLLEAFHPGSDGSPAGDRGESLRLELENALKESLDVVREQKLNFEEGELIKKKSKKGGWPGAIQEELNTMRTHFTERLAEQIESRINCIIDDVRSEMIDLITQSDLSGLAANDTNSTRLEHLIEIAENENAERIERGLRFIMRMDISYHSQIHPSIRQQLYSLDPLSPFNSLDQIAPTNEPKRSAETIRKGLDTEWDEVCYRVKGPLSKTCETVPWGVYAAFEECIDRLFRGKNYEYEWDKILYGRRHRIWKDEYEAVSIKMERASLCKEFAGSLQVLVSQISELDFTTLK